MIDCEMKKIKIKKCLDFIVFLSPLWIGIFWELKDMLQLNEDTTIALCTCLMIVLGILFVVSIVLDFKELNEMDEMEFQNKKIRPLKIIAEIIISYLVAYFFCDASVVMFIFLFFTVTHFEYKEKKTDEQDLSVNPVFIIRLVLLSLVGLFLMLLGRFVLSRDIVVVIGAIVFAPTVTNLVVWGIPSLIKEFSRKSTG